MIPAGFIKIVQKIFDGQRNRNLDVPDEIYSPGMSDRILDTKDVCGKCVSMVLCSFTVKA